MIGEVPLGLEGKEETLRKNKGKVHKMCTLNYNEKLDRPQILKCHSRCYRNLTNCSKTSNRIQKREVTYIQTGFMYTITYDGS